MSGRKGTVDVLSASLWPGQTLGDWAHDPTRAFEAWLAGQVADVEARRRFREVSQATYRTHFAAWVKHLARAHCTLLEAGPAEAASFFHARETPLDPVSRRRYLQLINRVYASLRTLGWSGVNPVSDELKLERVLPTVAPDCLDDAQVARLFEAVALLPGWKGVRDRALLALLVGAGLRANEAMALSRAGVGADFSVDIAPAGVHRAHRSRLLPGLPRQHWLDWCAQRDGLGVLGPLAFPATLAGRPYTESGFVRRIDTWLEAADIAKKDSAGRSLVRGGATLLRNTFARQALERYTPEEVQEFLGHDELRATLRHLPPELRPA